MEHNAATIPPSVGQATFAFVEDLARALNGREPIEIPSFPSIAARVAAVLGDENSTPEKIKRVVGSEPGLAARLLNTANSAAFNTSGQQVLDIKTAINRLGHDHVRASSMSYAMKNLMDSRTVEELKPYLHQLWNHSVQVAAIAYSLAARAPGVKSDEALFVGLVHDIGKLYILTRIEDYPQLCNCPETLDHIVSEWHTSIGKSIIESWNFPDYVQEAIELHEDTDLQSHDKPNLTDVIVVANLFANAHDDNDGQVDFENISSCRRMGIDAQIFHEIMVESQSEIDELENSLRG